MRKTILVLAALAFTACARDKEYDATGEVDSTKDTTSGFSVDVDMKKDTINVPTFGTETDTMIVKKPTYEGKKQVEIKRPTVDVKRP